MNDLIKKCRNVLDVCLSELERVNNFCSRGRPAKTWLSCIEKDMKSNDLENVDLLNRAEWRKCIS